MKFSTREDIDATIAEVFAAFSDFDRLERQAMRRGAEIERLDAMAAPAAGMQWLARFRYNGRPRELHCEVTSFRPPEGYEVTSAAGGVTGLVTVELIALSLTRTRIKVGLELKPASFSGRLFIQSLRLAKGTLDDRFKARIAALADDVRGRFAAG